MTKNKILILFTEGFSLELYHFYEDIFSQKDDCNIVGSADLNEQGELNIYEVDMVGIESSGSYATIKNYIVSVDFHMLLIPISIIPENCKNF